MRFSIIRVEAIVHLKGISGAFDNCFWLIHFNTFYVGNPTVHGSHLSRGISSNVWPRVDRILVLINAYSAFQNFVNPQIIQRFTSSFYPK